MDGAQAPAKVKTEVKDRIGIVTLNDPATLNAAGIDLMDGLSQAVADFLVSGGHRLRVSALLCDLDWIGLDCLKAAQF